MLKKINKSLVIIIILAGFNVILLFQKINLQNRVVSLNSLVVTQKNQLAAFNQLSNTEKLTDDFIKLPDSDISLLVFFPTSSCSSCLIYEVRNFNNFYSKHEIRARAYLLGSDRSILEKSGAKFPFKSIRIKNFVSQIGFNFTNPLALLVDSNGMIQDIYIAEIGNETKSNGFYRRMTSLFQSVE